MLTREQPRSDTHREGYKRAIWGEPEHHAVHYVECSHAATNDYTDSYRSRALKRGRLGHNRRSRLGTFRGGGIGAKKRYVIDPVTWILCTVGCRATQDWAPHQPWLDKFQLCIECLGFGFALSNKFRRPVSPCRYSAFSRTTKSQCLFMGMIFRVGPPRAIIRWLTARI